MGERRNSIAFSPNKIGNLQIKNRLVRSATFSKMATTEGEVTEEMVGFYSNLAKGGIGLIITGHTGVHPKGITNTQMLRITEDRFIPGLNRISSAVHQADRECKIVLQLNHAGRQQVAPELGLPAVAPSAVYDNLFQRTPKELTVGEIDEIIESFAEGIRRAKIAGFDGAQLHSAHGWLLSSFLSPLTNKRSDKYGGTTKKRVRILKEIFESAQGKVGDEFPILIKLNTGDCMPGGMEIEEAKTVARHISEIGFSAIEISGGMWEAITRSEEELGWKPFPVPEARMDILKKDQEAYFWDQAKEIKKDIHTKVILVGGIRSIDKIEDILNEGSVDFCSMARPLIREPDLPNRWLRGEGSRRSKCISCNHCLPKEGRPVECRANEKHDMAAIRRKMFPYFQK